jgi:hypothetical protein
MLRGNGVMLFRSTLLQPYRRDLPRFSVRWIGLLATNGRAITAVREKRPTTTSRESDVVVVVVNQLRWAWDIDG